MSLITIGNINDFAMKESESYPPMRRSGKMPAGNNKTSSHTVARYSLVEKDEDSKEFDFLSSKEKRGINLKSIMLEKGFMNIFNTTKNIYFLAWAWDLSGKPINFYPGIDFDQQKMIIPIKSGSVREFIGDGISLFPKRNIKAGVSIRIQLWESDQDKRDLGNVISQALDTIQNSELTNILTVLSSATGIPGITLSAIGNASTLLANSIGTILKNNGDDYIDFFEGSYSADKKWIKGEETYHGNSSEITLIKY